MTGTQRGFSLLEAVVAIALLAFVVTHFLGTRTEAMIDAAEARNWRVARELAEMYLSELRAGARELPPDNGIDFDIPDFEGFRARFLIGESAIAQAESDMAALHDDTLPPGASRENTKADRVAWQQERDLLRRAKSQGLSFTDYQDRLFQEELEEQIPSETDFEDVAIVVTFPRISSPDPANTEATFVLKARITTMALQGLTPEEAEIVTKSRGEESTGAANLPPGLGNPTGNGNDQ